MSSSMTWSSSTSLKSWTRSKMERNTICQLPGWCPGNFQWQASLLQSEVVSNHFFQSWNINHQREFAKKSFRSDITVVCKAMEFGLYPLDNHKCYLILTSCKCGQLLKYCQMIQYFQTSNNIFYIYNIIYILSDLLCKCFCRVITLQCFSLQDKIHPPTLNTYDIFFSVQSNQVCHKLANQKTPNIWILSIFNYHIYFRSKLVIFLSFVFQLDMTRSIWSLRANGCIGCKWYSMIFWL